MSFRNKIDFFVPSGDGSSSSKPLVADGDGIFAVGKKRVLRLVVGAADVRIRFGETKEDLEDATDATNGMLLEAGSVVYVSTSKFKFMKPSAALDSVEITGDRG